MAMLAEAANGAAAEWDAEHMEERLKARKREGLVGSASGARAGGSSSALDALEKSPCAEPPASASSPMPAWPGRSGAGAQQAERAAGAAGQQQPAGSVSPGQPSNWAASSPPSSCSLPHHLAALIPSPNKVCSLPSPQCLRPLMQCFRNYRRRLECFVGRDL